MWVILNQRGGSELVHLLDGKRLRLEANRPVEVSDKDGKRLIDEYPRIERSSNLGVVVREGAAPTTVQVRVAGQDSAEVVGVVEADVVDPLDPTVQEGVRVFPPVVIDGQQDGAEVVSSFPADVVPEPGPSGTYETDPDAAEAAVKEMAVEDRQAAKSDTRTKTSESQRAPAKPKAKTGAVTTADLTKGGKK